MKQQLSIDRVKSRPKRSLGQNFLNDDNFLRLLSKNITTNNDTTIIEIGPGKGALTNYLIKKKIQIFIFN